MNKKIIFVLISTLFLFIGVYFWQMSGNNPQTQSDAIKQAQEYQPNGFCTEALVPAVHKATGAKYTFTSGCLAPGWEPERKIN